MDPNNIFPPCYVAKHRYRYIKATKEWECIWCGKETRGLYVQDNSINMNTKHIIKLLPKEQIDEVLNQPDCGIDLEFMGFLDIYDHLSVIIPRHFTVIDFGCAYAPQAAFFQLHRQYVGVDALTNKRFYFKNTVHFETLIAEFISHHLDSYNLDETFAICSYVPPWYSDNNLLVRMHFKNCFVYYPHGGYENKIPKVS